MPHHLITYDSQNASIKKTNWIFAGIFLFVVLIAGAFAMSSNPTEPNQQQAVNAPTASKLSAAETFFDFGTISMAKGEVSKSFAVKNPTADTVIAKKLYTSCMCTKASLIQGDVRVGPFGMPSHGGIAPISVEISPGAEVAVEAVFDPAAHGPAGVGPISREVFLETNDGGKLTLSFKANVIP